MRLSLVVAVITLAGFMAIPRAQGSVDGSWALTFDTPMAHPPRSSPKAKR